MERSSKKLAAAVGMCTGGQHRVSGGGGGAAAGGGSTASGGDTARCSAKDPAVQSWDCVRMTMIWILPQYPAVYCCATCGRTQASIFCRLAAWLPTRTFPVSQIEPLHEDLAHLILDRMWRVLTRASPFC